MARPNVVFIIDDQHRWDFMGYEGNGVTHAPNLDRLAKRGAILHSAYYTSPLCSPSRAAIASGRYGMNTGCFTNLHELPPGTPSFVNQLREDGYHTCAVGKTHMEIHAYDADYTSAKHRSYMESLGWCEVHEISGQGMLRTGIKCEHSEFLRQRGALEEAVEFYQQWHYFMDKESQAPNPPYAEWSLPEEFQETAWVGGRAVEWLRHRDKSRPFFLHVGFGAPHPPLEPLARFMDLYRSAPESELWGTPQPTDHMIEMRRAYRAMIGEIDHCVGEIERCLAEQGALDNTVIVFTSDHGLAVGCHGLMGKENLYEHSARVPLILQGPGIPVGKRLDDCLCGHYDLMPTLMEYLGVEAPTTSQGLSYMPVLRGEIPTVRQTLCAAYRDCMRMARDGRFKMIYYPHIGRTQLFDTLSDPDETNDRMTSWRSHPESRCVPPSLSPTQQSCPPDPDPGRSAPPNNSFAGAHPVFNPAYEPAMPRSEVEAIIQRLRSTLAAWQEENNDPVRASQ